VNIAFPALLIVVILLPGLLFRLWYRKGAWEYPIHVETFAEQVFKGIVAAAILHALWIAGARYVLGETVDLGAVLVLLTGATGDAQSAAIAATLSAPVKIFSYFLTIYVASPILGRLLHDLVRSGRWDLRIPGLRFDNDWHYVLTGEFLRFPENREPSTPIDVDLVQVSVVVEMGGESYLITGRLQEFFLDREGKLDRLVLADSYRRSISKDRGEGELQQALSKDSKRFYKIEGNYFVVPYAEVKNINIGYWALSKA
jgi:hypothetical protein